MSEPTVPPGPPPSNPPPPTAPPAPPHPSTAAGGMTPPPPSTTGGGTVSPNRGLMIALSYLWLLALIPLLTEKEDREVQWHAKHGLVLFGAEVIIGVLLSIGTIAIDHMGLFGCASGCVSMVFSVAVLILHVICIIKGVNGQRFIVPGVSQYADRF